MKGLTLLFPLHGVEEVQVCWEIFGCPRSLPCQHPCNRWYYPWCKPESVGSENTLQVRRQASKEVAVIIHRNGGSVSDFIRPFGVSWINILSGIKLLEFFTLAHSHFLSGFSPTMISQPCCINFPDPMAGSWHFKTLDRLYLTWSIQWTSIATHGLSSIL